MSEASDAICIGDTNLRRVDNVPRSIIRPEALQSVLRDNPMYNMTHQKRGYAFIFKMEDYGDESLNRRGATDDANKCREAFVTLKFEVREFSDLRKDQFLDELENIRIMQLDNCDSLFIIFMGHGFKDENTDREYIVLSDHQKVLTSELWKPFSADKCPSLAGQPKAFIIQACRGQGIEEWIKMKKRPGWGIDSGSEDEYTIPMHADMLMMWATYPDMRAIRDFRESTGIKGSVFLHYLCQVLHSDSEREDLLSMLVTVAHHVGLIYATSSGEKQMPYLASTLTRKVFFSERPRKLYEIISNKPKADRLLEMVASSDN